MKAPSDHNIPVNWKRHTIIWLTPKGRLDAADHILPQPWESCETPEWKKELVNNPLVPGIICRQPTTTKEEPPILKPGFLLAGFSHWKSEQGSRLRMSAVVEATEVCHSCTPFDLCAPDQRDPLCRSYPLLRSIFSTADQYGIELGLFGSMALEWVTGFPYRNPDSDIDLCIRQTKNGDLEGFGKSLTRLEKKCGSRLDVEVEIADGYGVKLKELFSSSKTVLAKGLYDVKLFDKTRQFS